VSAADLPRSVRDPDGRTVLFTERAWRHISAARPGLLDEMEAILGAVERPDLRESGRKVWLGLPLQIAAPQKREPSQTPGAS
jgi:hypothetical protein